MDKACAVIAAIGTMAFQRRLLATVNVRHRYDRSGGHGSGSPEWRAAKVAIQPLQLGEKNSLP
jgi:hypothetical protein